MKCVELAETSPPTAIKDALSRFKEMPAQSAFEEFAKRVENSSMYSRGNSSETARKNVGDRVATLGSDGMVYFDKDNGIFSAVLAAYDNHWKLRTSPDDWWFCVVKKVSFAIDENAEKKAVRDLFVEHEGKKSICVPVPTTCIYDVDYRWVLLYFYLISTNYQSKRPIKRRIFCMSRTGCIQGVYRVYKKKGDL
jgi:hypothetical protein